MASAVVGGLTKTGNGLVTITNANTFTGGVTITRSGTVAVSAMANGGRGPAPLGAGFTTLSLGGGAAAGIHGRWRGHQQSYSLLIASLAAV